MPSQRWDCDRGAAGGAALQGWTRGQPASSAPPGKRKGAAEAVPGPDPCCHQLPAPGAALAAAAAGCSSHSSASQRLELKNLIFPFSGASAPAQGRERSREVPTLPEGTWQLPRMPSLLSLCWAVLQGLICLHTPRSPAMDAHAVTPVHESHRKPGKAKHKGDPCQCRGQLDEAWSNLV